VLRLEVEGRVLRAELEATLNSLVETRAEAARLDAARCDAVAEVERERAAAARRADDVRREAEAEIARERDESRRDSERLAAEVESLRMDLGRLRESSATDQEAALEARDRAWSDRLASARAEADGRLAAAEADICQLEGEAADALLAFEQARGRRDELAREAERLAHELEEVRSSLVEARAVAAVIPALQDELEAARRRAEALDANLTEARREVDRLVEVSDMAARSLDEAANAARETLEASEVAWAARLEEAGRRHEAELASAREEIDVVTREALSPHGLGPRPDEPRYLVRALVDLISSSALPLVGRFGRRPCPHCGRKSSRALAEGPSIAGLIPARVVYVCRACGGAMRYARGPNRKEYWEAVVEPTDRAS
jgi:chromosome segregation ATPase